MKRRNYTPIRDEYSGTPEDDVASNDTSFPNDNSDEGSGFENKNENKKQDISDDPLLNTDVFHNRRQMAWWSLYMIIALMVILFIFLFTVMGLFLWKPAIMAAFTNDYKIYLDWSSSFIGWGFSAFSAIILAYMGVSAYFYNGYLKSRK